MDPPAPAASGRGRKQGAVKASKQSTSNRAFYLLIAAVAVGGIAWLTYQSTRSKDVVETSPIDTTLPKVESQGYVLGSPTARLEVTEFGDFECPACGHFSTITEPDIRKKFVGSGLVRWRFIDYPLSRPPQHVASVARRRLRRRARPLLGFPRLPVPDAGSVER